MFAVVALHCTRVFTLGASEDSAVYYAAATLFKFATIGFFLVSGFLLQRNLQTCGSLELLRKRIRKVFVPWLFWGALFVAVLGASDFAQHRAPFGPGVSVAAGLVSEATRGLTTTALWFVPNLIVGLAVLLIFRRHLQSLWLGGALLLVNLFYTANIYSQWMPAGHTRALFAFIFYLWFGQSAGKHLQAFSRTLSNISSAHLVSLTLGAAVAAFCEGRLLLHLHATDPLNTLRFSNQIFSVLVVLCLCKLPTAIWPRFVDVPRHTFGIYLSHALIVGILLTLMRHLLESPRFAAVSSNVVLRIGLWGAATAVAWTTGFLLSRRIASTRSLCWMLGISPGALPERHNRYSLVDGVAHFIG
jgi:surface polysaccharide O-acyltransferase-like enzyme